MAQVTKSQREFWDEIGFEPLTSRNEDEIAARVHGLQHVFSFDGYDPPSRDASSRNSPVGRRAVPMTVRRADCRRAAISICRSSLGLPTAVRDSPPCPY